ncbi:MAG: hypothetical protein WAW00_00195 [Candidatus Moraniibacteriota bacterium]
MNQKNTETLSKRRIVFSVLFISMLLFSVPRGAHADYWGASYAAVGMDQMISQIKRAIEGALLGALKSAAIQALNQQVGQLIGGGSSSGQALFITNYDDFLYKGPAQRTELYMNDFFTMTTRGKGSSANYSGAGSSGGIGGNYASYLTSVGKQATVQQGAPRTTNLEEYTSSPQAMFAEGDWRAFNAFFSNPANNPYGYSLQAEQAYQNKLAQEQQEALVQAQSAGGFLPSRSGNTVVAPGGSIQAAQTDVQNLPNTFLATATNPGELLSGVIAAMANKMVSGLIQNGIGQVQSNVQRENGNVQNQVSTALEQATKAQGPGAAFTQEIQQRTSIGR